MQGAIDQVLALTITGNAFLQGWDIGAFWPDAETFVFCAAVDFVAPEGLVASDPNAWLRELRQDGARLRLAFLPRNAPGIADRDGVGFANSGPRWLIEAAVPGLPPSWWEPHWRPTKAADAPSQERRIWSVTYRRAPAASALPQPRPFPALGAELGEALDALVALVERAAPEEAIPGWAEHFRRARSVLETDDGRHQRGDPGPPFFLRAEARRMLHACRAAWVFGGMGAWNDGAYWGSVEAEGDRLSEALFGLLQQGIVAVANSTAG